MKTILKTILPLVALVVLMSGRPVSEDADKAFERRSWPTGFSVTVNGVSPGSGCVSSGSGTLCLYWTGGSLEAANIATAGGITVSSKNPDDVCCGSHCWNITVGNDSVFIVLEGYTEADGWQTVVVACFDNCNGHMCS